MSPAALPYESAPAELVHVCGVCRVCGCTNEEGCLLEVNHDEGYIVTCSWAECDLCSRCWGPRRPTGRQAGEIARIADRHGPVRVTRGRGICQLEVTLVGDIDLGKHFVVRPAVLTLDADGRLVHRLAREVIPTETVAPATGGEVIGSCKTATPHPAPPPSTSSESYEQLDRLHSRWRSV